MSPAFTTVPRFIQRVLNLREQFSAVEGRVALSDEPGESLVADGLVACVDCLTYSVHGHLALIDKLSRFLHDGDT